MNIESQNRLAGKRTAPILDMYRLELARTLIKTRFGKMPSRATLKASFHKMETVTIKITND